MDVLLALPLLSYAPAPAWAPSLSALVLFLAWSALALAHPPLALHMTGVATLRIGLWLVPALASLAADVALPGLAAAVKFGGRASLPPRRPRALAGLTLLALANLGVALAAEAAAAWALAAVRGRPVFGAGPRLPAAGVMLRDVGVLLAAREAVGYYVHRFVLHGGGRVGRAHRRAAHGSAGAPFSLRVLADDPAAVVLHRVVPVFVPAAVLRPHLLTYLAFVAASTAEETLSLSGYSVVPGIVLGRMARRAAVHYAGRGASDFGAWGLLDWLHGTGSGAGGRRLLDNVRVGADGRHARERSAGAAASGALGSSGTRRKVR